MASSSSKPFVCCIAGPTGAGKTAAALALAGQQPVAVINADSRQTYRDFPIITAQPSAGEQSVCPHLLYGFLPTEEKLGAGAWSRLAGQAIDGSLDLARLPLLVGGTGLYFKALLEGIAPIPAIPPDVSRKWLERCEDEGSLALHRLLSESDPEYAAKIHPNDRQRITRALEVLDATGKTFTWWHSRTPAGSPYRTCKIGIALGLDELDPILAQRIELMFEQGALEEAARAKEICTDPAAPGWSGIGCAEVYRYLEGELSLDECLELWRKNTRAYAKRQLTWFRADKEIRWFRPEQADEIVRFVSTAESS